MVAAPLTFETRSANGPRPINLRKDIPQVLSLLNLVFGPSLDAEGRRQLNSMSLSQQPWVVLRLRQLADGIVPGLVWEDAGQIVGNVSLLTTRVNGRYLLANVAVHPDYRRRGIARSLMAEVMDLVQARGARELMLQVKHDNQAAHRLYVSLGFDTLGSITSWHAAYSQMRTLPVPTSSRSPDQFSHFFLRPLQGNEWHTAWRLDQASLHPDLNWPEPLPKDAYRMGFLRWLDNTLNGRRSESWVMVNDNETMVGLATILSEWGRAHTLSLRAHPSWQGRVERPLLAKLLRRLQYLPRRPIRMNHLADDGLTTTLLHEANFSIHRTLTVMKLAL